MGDDAFEVSNMPIAVPNDVPRDDMERRRRIEEGLADVEAGRTIGHEAVMAWARLLLAAAAPKT